VVNAFAVPGGYVYITRGILAQFNNEAELLGVLGHEMGHVTARHSASQQSKQQLGQLLLMGGMIASDKFREFGEYAMQGMELLFLKFSRDNESEADRLGVEYSSKIGYDANQMANFFNVLNKMQMSSDHAGVPTFMSTHPDPGDRYNAVRKSTQAWQDSLKLANYAVNGDQYLRMIDGLVYGEDPRQGFVENNMFFHPEMKFKYPVPPGWQVQNSPIQVHMAPKDGNALMIFTMAPQKTLEEAGQKTLADLNLTVLDSKRTSVNGFPAIAAISQQVTQNQQTGAQQTIKVISYLIQYGETILVFHGVADDANFNSYYRLFESTMTNFDRLTDPSKLNIKPKRIKIVSVPAAGTLSQTFKGFKVPDSQAKELSLLNNMELSQQVSKGKLIKIISN
jgi:predicted Zn-dependent protease